MKDRLFYAII